MRLTLILLVLTSVPALCVALPRSSVVAVVGPGGLDESDMVRLIARAGGSVVRPGGRPNVIIAASTESGFVTRLYRAGAWLVLDPIVTDGCLKESMQNQ
jgi:hypothetical protein